MHSRHRHASTTRFHILNTRRTLTALIVASLALAAPALALGKFFQAIPAGYAQVDPIAAHGNARSDHLHLFLGASGFLKLPHPEAASYASVVGKDTGISNNPDDTAAYWIPALLYTSGPNAGKPVPFRKFFAYYRSFDHQTTGAAEPYAPDTRLITGNGEQPAKTPLDTSRYNWTCDERSSRAGPYPDIATANCAAAKGSVYLTAHVDFPSCWDGKLAAHNVPGDTRDSAHYAFASKHACPAGFPIKMTELRETFKWDYQGDGSDVALSSDLVQRKAGNMVKPGQTLHADFWNTWVQTGGAHGGLVGMVRSCINAATPASWCNS